MDEPVIIERIERFAEETQEAVFVREIDSVLFIRPDKTMKVNWTAAAILSVLYGRSRGPVGEALRSLALRWQVPYPTLLADTDTLVRTLGGIFGEDFTPGPALRLGKFDRKMLDYPALSEIALTYACQNRCQFCYAGSPCRAETRPPMRTAEVMRVMDKIFHQAHVPSLSFTGGEPTLRADLPELIRHGKTLGLRVNLITNGLRLSSPGYAGKLVEAGLDSAQISIEAADPALHDSLVGRNGAYRLTVQGIRNLRALGIHVHTNTTLNAHNLEAAPALIRFLHGELGLRVLSMNMVIQTGEALARPGTAVTYSEVAARLPGLLAEAAREGIKLVWYSPIPYCLFNPVLHGLGAKSCACVSGILSVDPTGEVLPCSSFGSGIGSLLRESFESIYRGRKARYWRERRFQPPVCAGCPDLDVCGGACPLYWDAQGGFGELPRTCAADRRLRSRWERDRQRSRGFGVGNRGEAIHG